MFKFNPLIRHLRSPEGGGEGGGGGGSGKPKLEITPEIQAAIDEATAGLKAKNGELLGLQRDLKDKLKTFDGINPDAVRSILKRFNDDEEAAMIAKGEIDKVLDRRTERMREEMTAKEKAAADKIAAAEARAAKYSGRVLDNAIRAALGSAGLHAHAVDDALLHARQMFVLDDDGNAVQLGDDHKPVLGKDGKTPFSPAEWIESMKAKKPHWFPANASGGGSGGGGGGGNNFSGEKSAREMTAGEKAAFIGKHGNEAWSKKVATDYAKPAGQSRAGGAMLQQ